MDGLELTQIERLVDEPNLKVYTIGGGQIDPDLVHVKPQEEPLDLNALEAGDGPVAELAGDGLVVIDQVLELHVAGIGQEDDEPAVIGGGVVDDRVG
jgi:hypothetical protein